MFLLAFSSIGFNDQFFQECLKSLLLGVIQGLTEFFPISSTAHLKVIPELLNWGDPGVSKIASIQLGSIIAVVYYFSEDLKAILKSIYLAFVEERWSEKNYRLGCSILVGTFPILCIGLFIKLFWPGYNDSPIRSLYSIAICSIVMALLLALAEIYGTRRKKIDDISILDGFFIGLSQALAIIPGVSRSGITLTTSLFMGCQRLSAARFSFLLGIPAITISGLVELKSAITEESLYGLLPLLVCIISAGVTSFYAIDCLLKFLQKNSTKIFIYYRLSFGFLLLYILMLSK